MNFENDNIFTSEDLDAFCQEYPADLWEKVEKECGFAVPEVERPFITAILGAQIKLFRAYSSYKFNLKKGEASLALAFLRFYRTRLKKDGVIAAERRAMDELFSGNAEYRTVYIAREKKEIFSYRKVFLCGIALVYHSFDLSTRDEDRLNWKKFETCYASLYETIEQGTECPHLFPEDETIDFPKRREAKEEKTEKREKDEKMKEAKAKETTAKTETRKKQNEKYENPRLAEIKKIKAYFDRHVVGQEEAKFAMAIVGENLKHSMDTKRFVKPVLLSGPTGSGKTYLSTLLSEYLKLPFLLVDTTEVTQNGFAGRDVSEIAKNISSKMSISGKKAAIVVLDEWDKRCIPSFDKGGSDVSAMAQTAFLKIFEQGYKCQGESFDQVLFLMTGSFYYSDEMEKAVDPGKEKRVGFNREEKSVDKNQKKKEIDLRSICQSSGMIPELIGRTERFIMLEKLDEKAILEILTRKKGALVKMENSLKEYDIQIHFHEEAKLELARQILKENLGARSVENVIAKLQDKILMNCMTTGKCIVYVAEDCSLSFVADMKELESLIAGDKVLTA